VNHHARRSYRRNLVDYHLIRNTIVDDNGRMKMQMHKRWIKEMMQDMGGKVHIYKGHRHYVMQVWWPEQEGEKKSETGVDKQDEMG